MIAPMTRVRIAGPKSAAPAVISAIYRLGVFHLTIPRHDPVLESSKTLSVLSIESENEKLRLAESVLANIREARSLLPSAKQAALPAAIPMMDENEWLAQAASGRLSAIIREILQITRDLASLEAEIKEVKLYRELFEDFQPLLTKVGSSRGMEISGVTLASGYADVFDEMKRTLEEVTSGACAVFKGKEDERGLAALLLYPASFADEARRRVFGHKVRPIKPPEKYEKGSFAATLKTLFMREREISSAINAIQSRLMDISGKWGEQLAMAEEAVKRLMGPLRSQGSVAGSEMSFWLSGWVPDDDAPRLREALESEFGGSVAVYSKKPSRDEYPVTPVKLHNNRWARPFERLIDLYSPPMYGAVDPTAMLAVTGPMFFGLMLGDIGYAFALAVLAWIVRRKMPDDALAADLSGIAMNCSLWTGFFGAVFGEFFGGVSAWTPLVHRKEDAMTVLVMTVTLGGAHLCLGSVVGFFSDFRLGAMRKAAERLADFALIASLFVSAWAAWSGMGGPVVFLPLAPLAARIAIAGVSEGGLEAPKILANILSYSRLMAIGLSSVILADMGREIYEEAPWAALGVLGAVSIHSLNFLMGLYAPAIQAARLHYVEFFNRFYALGGMVYSPLKMM